MNPHINEYEHEVHRIIIYKMTAIHFDEIMKFHISAENAPIRIYVLKGWLIILWHVRSVIDFFGSKESLKMSKYYNQVHK